MARVAWPGTVGAAQAYQASLSLAVQQVGPDKTWLSSCQWDGEGRDRHSGARLHLLSSCPALQGRKDLAWDLDTKLSLPEAVP